MRIPVIRLACHSLNLIYETRLSKHEIQEDKLIPIAQSQINKKLRVIGLYPYEVVTITMISNYNVPAHTLKKSIRLSKANHIGHLKAIQHRLQVEILTRYRARIILSYAGIEINCFSGY